MTKTRPFAATALACAAAVSLSACGTVSGGQSGLAPVIDALARAGCAGNFSFGGGATTAAGLSPGSGHIENSFSGTCDPRNARPVAAPADPTPLAPAAIPPGK